MVLQEHRLGHADLRVGRSVSNLPPSFFLRSRRAPERRAPLAATARGIGERERGSAGETRGEATA
eukprot:7735659-Pyramimonas_sp.AAC.1